MRVTIHGYQERRGFRQFPTFMPITVHINIPLRSINTLRASRPYTSRAPGSASRMTPRTSRAFSCISPSVSASRFSRTTGSVWEERMLNHHAGYPTVSPSRWSRSDAFTSGTLRLATGQPDR